MNDRAAKGEEGIRLRRRKLDRRFLVSLIAVLLAAAVLSAWLEHAVFSWDAGIAAALVLLGFALPKWIGHGVRKARAEQWKTAEMIKWGFHSRDREGPWINYIDHPVVKRTPLVEGRRFFAEWLMICDGMIIVNPGVSTVDHEARTVTYDHSVRAAYAWDGCTPKCFFWWLMVIGTPDWWHGARTVQTVDPAGRIVNRTVIWQLAHHASLVHDALYQYLEHVPLSKKDVDALFYAMLKDSGMCRPVAKIYHLAVCMFGPCRDRTIPRIENGHYELLGPLPAAQER